MLLRSKSADRGFPSIGFILRIPFKKYLIASPDWLGHAGQIYLLVITLGKSYLLEGVLQLEIDEYVIIAVGRVSNVYRYLI